MNQRKHPKGVERTVLQRKDDFPLWFYRPKNTVARGAIYLLPGLHYEGPADERLDRFARVLSAAGMIVGVPALPSMIDLQMSSKILEEAESGLRFFLRQELPCLPGVMSISAASIAAFHLGAHSVYSRKIRGILTFGGFSDWEEAVFFSLTGRLSSGELMKPDPLGIPVLFLNFIDELDEDIIRPRALERAIYSFVSTTWEKPEYQEWSAYTLVARQLAERVEDEDRALFYQACSVLPGGAEILERTILKLPPEPWLDPKPLLEALKVPLKITHGRDDSVIPYTQADDLNRLMPEALKHKPALTGFYNHTGISDRFSIIKNILLLPKELIASFRLLYGLLQVSGLAQLQNPHSTELKERS
ncbi:MAG: hypothetical protein CMK59_08390 [Proteobacteria bacterium]|nr:hypothetical protein [Pseudomonadota bacterium]